MQFGFLVQDSSWLSTSCSLACSNPQSNSHSKISFSACCSRCWCWCCCCSRRSCTCFLDCCQRAPLAPLLRLRVPLAPLLPPPLLRSFLLPTGTMRKASSSSVPECAGVSSRLSAAPPGSKENICTRRFGDVDADAGMFQALRLMAPPVNDRRCARLQRFTCIPIPCARSKCFPQTHVNSLSDSESEMYKLSSVSSI